VISDERQIISRSTEALADLISQAAKISRLRRWLT